MKKLSVSLVIPNYNGIGYIEKLLHSIYSQTIPFEEIIIIDDASTDQSVVFIKTNYPSIKLIENKINQGFAKSVNYGIRSSNSRYVCLLNNDLYLTDTWLEKAMEPFKTGNNIGAVATNILLAESSGLVDSQGDDYFITGSALKHNHLKKNDIENKITQKTFSACAAAAIYDKTVLEKTGLLDEFLNSYYEDVDLSFRINLSGYKIIYTPHAQSFHHLSSAYGKTPRKMLFNSYRNEEIVFWADMPGLLLCKYFLLRIIFLFMQSIVKIFKMQFIVYLQAKISAIMAIPYIIKKRTHTQKLKNCSARKIDSLLRKDWITHFILTKFNN